MVSKLPQRSQAAYFVDAFDGFKFHEWHFCPASIGYAFAKFSASATALRMDMDLLTVS